MEQGRDVDNMMTTIWKGLTYAGIIGQIPELHPWLLGNPRLTHFLDRTGLMVDNPFLKIVTVWALDVFCERL